MNSKFALTPDAFPSIEKGCGEYTSCHLTRRAFLKRTGGATVAAVVAFHLIERVNADGSNEEEIYWDMGCGATDQILSSWNLEVPATDVDPAKTVMCALRIIAIVGNEGEHVGDTPVNFYLQLELHEGANWIGTATVHKEYNVVCNSETGSITVTPTGSVEPIPPSTGNVTVNDVVINGTIIDYDVVVTVLAQAASIYGKARARITYTVGVGAPVVHEFPFGEPFGIDTSYSAHEHNVV